MIVTYDPVAQAITLHGEDGFPRYDARGRRLLVKHYMDEGIFICEMRGEAVELAYVPVEGAQLTLRLEELAPGRWRLHIAP